MARTAEGMAALEERRKQALARMDRNDEVVREARAGRIADAINTSEIVSRVPTDEFFSREHEQN
jgi:hypothetical protein